MFTDTHAHIYREYYDDIDLVIQTANDSGIYRIINNGCSNKSNIEVLELIKKYPNMYGALGIHPEEVDNYQDSDLTLLEEHLKDDKIIAIGEIGLDYHYTKENKDKQIILLEKQLKLAETYNLPVIIHSRDATLDTINILKKFKVTGVVHSFSGSLETANIFINMGYKLGINGVITFKNAKLKDVVKDIPLQSLVLETDSPYLTPEPFRGKTNEPSNVKVIAQFIADLKDIDVLELAKITNQNIREIFDI